MPQGMSGNALQSVPPHRFGQVVERPQADRLGGRIHGGLARDHHHRTLQVLFPDEFEQFHAAMPGQNYVGQDEIEIVFFQSP